MPPSAERKRPQIDVGHAELSIRRQCALLGLNRSSFYYAPAGGTPENLRLMRLIDEQYTARPFYGSRRMTAWLEQQGEEVNRKRVQRLMRLMGLEAIYPKPRLSAAGAGHRVYPYLLRGVTIERPDQVWSADITFVPMVAGFMYLAASLLQSRAAAPGVGLPDPGDGLQDAGAWRSQAITASERWIIWMRAAVP